MRDSDEERSSFSIALRNSGRESEQRGLSGGYKQYHIGARREQTKHGGGRHVGQAVADYYSRGEALSEIEGLRSRAALYDAHYSHFRNEAAQLRAHLVG